MVWQIQKEISQLTNYLQTDSADNTEKSWTSSEQIKQNLKQKHFTESSHLPPPNSFWKNICTIAGGSGFALPRYKDFYGTDSGESRAKPPEWSESLLQSQVSQRVHTVSIVCHIYCLPSNPMSRTSIRGPCTCRVSTFLYGSDPLSWWLSCRPRCCSGQQYAWDLLR